MGTEEQRNSRHRGTVGTGTVGTEEQWAQRQRGTVGTEEQRNSRHRRTEEQWAQRNSRHRGQVVKLFFSFFVLFANYSRLLITRNPKGKLEKVRVIVT